MSFALKCSFASHFVVAARTIRCRVSISRFLIHFVVDFSTDLAVGEEGSGAEFAHPVILAFVDLSQR